jgi:hypothetical protein
MPKHIRPPKCTLIAAFKPTKLMIKHDREHWYVRAQQTSPLGTSWLTISRHITAEAAHREIDKMALPGIIHRDTSEPLGGEPVRYLNHIISADE